MINIVASDMDGTLLDENSNVPPETFDLVKRLDKAGIRFVVSSGRRYDTLREMFEPVVGYMDFVASNGAQVYVRGKLVDLEIFSYASVRRLYDVVRMFDGLHLALFDRYITYLMDDKTCFERELDKNLPHPVRSIDIPSAGTTIVKASIYCDDALMDMAYVLERELGDEFTFAPSGHKWIDVMRRGVSKATGMNQVLRAYGLSADSLMAFGDSMNDYEILRMAGTSVAMGNAREAIKEIATKVIGTNVEQSVQAELKALLAKRSGSQQERCA
jgi:Cof subfamily protein (haloacid dehalogenase superfamily)